MKLRYHCSSSTRKYLKGALPICISRTRKYFDGALFNVSTLDEREPENILQRYTFRFHCTLRARIYLAQPYTTFNHLNIASEWDNNNFKRRHFRNLMSHSRRYCDASTSPSEGRELRGLKVNASPRVIEVLMLLKRSIFVSYMTLWFENIFRDISEIFWADFARTNFFHVSRSILTRNHVRFSKHMYVSKLIWIDSRFSSLIIFHASFVFLILWRIEIAYTFRLIS